MHRWARGLFGAALIFLALYGVKKVCKLPPAPLPPKPIVIPKPPIGNPYEIEVIRLTNAFRNKHGLPSLKADPAMMKFSRNWSAVMANGRMVHSRGPYGENICKCYKTPEAAVQAWIRSPPHRRNMLSSRYTYIGVGQISTSWTQCFK